MRYKIARLAAALAARTFSTGDNLEVLAVRRCHVDYIVRFLERIYGSPTFGYKDFTEAIRMTQQLVDEKVIRKQVNETPFPRDFARQLLHTDKIDMQDICDWCAWDRVEAQVMLSFLVRKHALMRSGRSYRKTAPFIELLKDLLEGDGLIDRPDFIPEEEF
jgi:hypothetical protein